MNYLVIKDNTITQVCTSVEDLLEYLEINVTDEGIIEITSDGRQLPTSYNEEDLKDAFQSGFTNGFNINSVTFEEWFEQFKK